MISRSNWAKDSSTFKTKRPMEVPVENCWVIDTKATWCLSKVSIILAKSNSDRENRSNLYTTMASIWPAWMSASMRFRAGRSMLPPVEAAVVVAGFQAGPALVLLAGDVGLGGLALGVQ